MLYFCLNKEDLQQKPFLLLLSQAAELFFSAFEVFSVCAEFFFATLFQFLSRFSPLNRILGCVGERVRVHVCAAPKKDER